MKSPMKSRRLVAVTLPLFAAVPLLVVSAVHVRAQSGDAWPSVLVDVKATGFRASNSSPFAITGTIGEGVWQRLVGPILGNTFATIPSSSSFGGAGCQPEYSQDQIVILDGSTLTFKVVGVRCVPATPAGAFASNGVYDIVGATGRFAGWDGAGTDVYE